jgi:hypothetical protein
MKTMEGVPPEKTEPSVQAGPVLFVGLAMDPRPYYLGCRPYCLKGPEGLYSQAVRLSGDHRRPRGRSYQAGGDEISASRRQKEDRDEK